MLQALTLTDNPFRITIMIPLTLSPRVSVSCLECGYVVSDSLIIHTLPQVEFNFSPAWLRLGQTREWILLERRERREDKKRKIINGFPAQRKWSHRWTRSSEIASLSLMIKIDSCSQLCCGAWWSLKMFSLSSCVFTRPTVILCVYNSSNNYRLSPYL